MHLNDRDIVPRLIERLTAPWQHRMKAVGNPAIRPPTKGQPALSEGTHGGVEAPDILGC